MNMRILNALTIAGLILLSLVAEPWVRLCMIDGKAQAKLSLADCRCAVPGQVAHCLPAAVAAR